MDNESLQEHIETVLKLNEQTIRNNLEKCQSEGEKLFLLGLMGIFGAVEFADGKIRINSGDCVFTVELHPSYGFMEYELYGFAMTCETDANVISSTTSLFVSCGHKKRESERFGDAHEDENRLLAKEGIPSVFFDIEDLRIDFVRCATRAMNVLCCMATRDLYRQTRNEKFLRILEEWGLDSAIKL